MAIDCIWYLKGHILHKKIDLWLKLQTPLSFISGCFQLPHFLSYRPPPVHLFSVPPSLHLTTPATLPTTTVLLACFSCRFPLQLGTGLQPQPSLLTPALPLPPLLLLACSAFGSHSPHTPILGQLFSPKVHIYLESVYLMAGQKCRCTRKVETLCWNHL